MPEFQTLVSSSIGRDIEVVALKKGKKLELEASLTEVAEYVTNTCNGNRGMLLSSGFPIAGDQYNKTEPVIEELTVELGPPCIATTRVKRVRDARAYLHQYTDEPPTAKTIWAHAGSKEAHYTFKGLQSVKKYWFRVVAIARNGQMVYSPVVERVIQ